MVKPVKRGVQAEGRVDGQECRDQEKWLTLATLFRGKRGQATAGISVHARELDSGRS